jgi:hypothetical protein
VRDTSCAVGVGCVPFLACVLLRQEHVDPAPAPAQALPPTPAAAAPAAPKPAQALLTPAASALAAPEPAQALLTPAASAPAAPKPRTDSPAAGREGATPPPARNARRVLATLTNVSLEGRRDGKGPSSVKAGAVAARKGAAARAGLRDGMALVRA